MKEKIEAAPERFKARVMPDVSCVLIPDWLDATKKLPRQDFITVYLSSEDRWMALAEAPTAEEACKLAAGKLQELAAWLLDDEAT